MAKAQSMILSILIATTLDHRRYFRKLHPEFERQIDRGRYPVQILFEEDNKQIPVGQKRQILLERAEGDLIVYFDADDWPATNYVERICKAYQGTPDLDCIGIEIAMTTNGRHPQTCCHSLKYKVWGEKIDGYDYVRNVTHFNPVRRELALKTGFKPIRFGEDKDYADRITPICKKEVFLSSPPLFEYRYSNQTPHNQKYGIK